MDQQKQIDDVTTKLCYVILDTFVNLTLNHFSRRVMIPRVRKNGFPVSVCLSVRRLCRALLDG